MLSGLFRQTFFCRTSKNCAGYLQAERNEELHFGILDQIGNTGLHIFWRHYDSTIFDPGCTVLWYSSLIIHIYFCVQVKILVICCIHWSH